MPDSEEEQQEAQENLSFKQENIINIDEIQDVEHYELVAGMDLSHNQLINIDQIGKFANIINLELQNNKLESISGIEQCEQLVYLNLNNNYLTDLSQLQFLPKLERLEIANNQLNTVKQLSPLIMLQGSLRSLTLFIPEPLNKNYSYNKIVFNTDELNGFIKEFFPTITLNREIHELEPGVRELYGKAHVYYKNDIIEYTGETIYMVPHGRGTLVYLKENKSFEGNFVAGYRSVGIEITSEYKYEGELNNYGSKEGNGILVTAQGDIYEGQFVGDRYCGKGALLYVDGSFYEGEFDNGLRNGHGVYYDTDGSVFTGQWRNDLANGEGRYEDANGNIEQGLWKNNEKTD